MDLLIYNEISDFSNSFYNENCILNTLQNIDSFKNALVESFEISKCKKVFKRFRAHKDYNESKKSSTLLLSKFKGSIIRLVSVVTNLYKMHPIIQNLILLFYTTKYKCYDRKIIQKKFDLYLRSYIGFFMERKILNSIFNLDFTLLVDFIFNALFLLNKAINFSRKNLVDCFYKYHFGNRFLLKEYSETKSVFELVDFKNKTTVNICAGNACGIHLLDTKMTCIDINKYTGMMLLEKMGICNFIQCDIMDKVFESIVPSFKLWISIHACGHLSVRIIKVFQKHASSRSELYLVPCCSLKKYNYKTLLQGFVYDRIYNFYYKKDDLKKHGISAMHMEYLSCLCIDNKFKIKTLKSMQSEKNKIIIMYKE